MKKVIHIISNGECGGAEKLLLDILRNINSEKFSTVLVCPKNGCYTETYKRYVNKIYTIDFKGNQLKLLRDLIRILKEEKADILYNHLFRASLYGTFIGYFLLKIKPKIINNFHSEISDDVSLPQIFIFCYQIIIFLLQFFSKSFVCVSEYSREKSIKQGVRSSKISVIYNGIDANKFYPNYKFYKKDEPFNIVFAGRIHPQKGVLTLIELRRILPSKFHFTILGDGYLRAEMQAIIDSENLQNIQLIGFVENVSNYVSEADLFVYPSKGDVFGMAVAEAMACGKPVVTTNVGGIPELIVEGKGGFLCPKDDVEMMKEKILFLADNPDLILQFGKYNRQRFEEHFTIKKMIKGIELLYEK